MEPRPARRRDTRLQTAIVGGLEFLLAAVLVYAFFRYRALIVPRYGGRFAYLAVALLVGAAWMLFRCFRAFARGFRGSTE